MTFHSVPRRALWLGLAAAALSTTALTAPALADKVLVLPVGVGAVGASVALDNLDPRVLLTTAHQAVQMAIFDSLVRSKGPDIVPAAAEKWEISADGKTYTFHLRDEKWSDGKAVTAQDFVDAFVRMFTTSPASGIYDAIQNGAAVRGKTADASTLGVKAVDDKTLVITLTSPTPYFLGLLTSAYSAPSRQDLIDKEGEKYGTTADSMAYNGPFMLTEWENQDKLVLKKNPNYWDAKDINLDEVDFLVIPDQNTQRNLYDNGQLDVYAPATETEAKDYEAKGQLLRYNKGGLRDITLNHLGQGDATKAKLFSDPNFMKWISNSIDRQGFVDKVLEGNGIAATVQTPAATSVYPGTTWGQVDMANVGKYHPLTADPAQADAYKAKVLADMGVTSVDQLPAFKMLTSEDPSNPKLMTPYVLSVLTQMGLKVTLDQETGNQYWNTLLYPARAYDIAIAGWGPDYDDPFTYMQYWQTSSTDMGTTFNNADYDKMLQDANNETDLKKRADMLVKAEALFSDIGTSIPLLHYKGEAAIQPYVKGITTSSFGVSINYVYADIQK
ncbi:MAG TPA: peptide ABC transporter substrate-binding protein [Devosia sp.]|jgi:oligopeptide transport system substrate-binding protein|nr:peptide ABC transporter substrate-binding protein [Devosia sp.]